VAATTPAGSALKGSDVGLLISTGVAYYQPDPQPQQQQPTPPGKQEKPPKPGKP
jgi:hypothetical protein